MVAAFQFRYYTKRFAALCALAFACGFYAEAQKNAAEDKQPVKAPAPKFSTDKKGRPNWVTAPYAAYDKKYYLAYTGSGKSRENSEAAAFNGLAGYFGQSVTGELTAAESFRESQSRGGRGKGAESALDQSVDSVVQISTAMDNLAGAEIGAVWQDTKDRAWYALAVMNRAKCAALYSAMLNEKNAALTKLTAHAKAARIADRMADSPAADSPAVTLEDVVRLRQAARIADEKARLTAVVQLLEGDGRKAAAGTGAAAATASGDALRLEARALAAEIPVAVNISGDTEGRLAAAFARAFESGGFTTGAFAPSPPAPGGARYLLSVSYHTAPVVLENQKNTFVRYELTANFTDTRGKTTLFTWAATGREGHISETEAGQRALRAAVERIKTEFNAELDSYLSGL